jgi:TonB family protein
MFTRFVMCALLFSTCAFGRMPEEALVPKAAVAPQYPPLAIQARVSGLVVVRAVIGASGDVTDAEVVSGHPVLKKAAIEAAKKWKFDSASPRTRTTTLKFTFVILPERAESDGETTFLLPDSIEVSKRPLPDTVNYDHHTQ